MNNTQIHSQYNAELMMQIGLVNDYTSTLFHHNPICSTDATWPINYGVDWIHPVWHTKAKMSTAQVLDILCNSIQNAGLTTSRNQK